MTVKTKDFQKAAAFLKEFLLKMNEDSECAELRDSLNLVLLHMQKYYQTLRQRCNVQDNVNLNASSRGLSPMTPFKDAPDKFVWRWVNVESGRIAGSLPIDGGSDNIKTLPLIIQAAKEGDVDLINKLVMKDRDCIHEVDCMGRSAIVYAVHFKQSQCLSVLLNNEADVNSVAHDGSMATHRVCHDGDHNALAILIQHNADVTVQDNQGRSPIHWACSSKNTECLKLLLAQNVDVCVRDKDGLSPSMWACRMDNIDHFQLLCETQDVDDGMEEDSMGKTWMHWAIRRSEPLECLQTLLTEETAQICDKEGKTVFLTAAEQGSVAACKVIIDIVGTDCISDTDNHGRSCLHLATMGGHGEMVSFLLEKGANMENKDKMNAAPMDYAKAQHLHYCQRILTAYSKHIDKKRKNNSNDSPSQSPQSEEDDNIVVIVPTTSPHPPSKPLKKQRHTDKSPHPPPRTLEDHISHNARQASAPVIRLHDTEEENRHVLSAGNERTAPDSEVHVASKNVLMRLESVDIVSDDKEQDNNVASRELYTPSPEAGNSLGGMDISDIDEDVNHANNTTQISVPRPPPRPDNKHAHIDHKENKEDDEPLHNIQPLPSADERRMVPGQLRPLEPVNLDSGSKSPKKKKKKDKKTAKSDPVASMPPVKGYVAPVQPPMQRNTLQPHPGNPYMNRNSLQDRQSPDSGHWGEDPIRPSAPVPPHSPRDPPPSYFLQGRASSNGGLQRMESEEDLCSIDAQGHGPLGYSNHGPYAAPNYNGSQPRDNAKSLLGPVANRQAPSMKPYSQNGKTAMQRPKTPMNGNSLGVSPAARGAQPPYQRILPSPPNGPGQKLMYGQAPPHPPSGRGSNR